MSCHRRDVLLVAGLGFGSLASGCTLLRWGAKHPVASAAQKDGNKLRVPLSELSTRPRGDVLEVRPGKPYADVLIRAEGSGFQAVVGDCPHLGCTIDWTPAETAWTCPCHDSRFDPQGKVLNGPAKEPLKVLPAAIEGDVLVVDLTNAAS